MCVSVITLIDETVSIINSLLWEKTFEQYFMWHMFVCFKEFVKPQTKAASSSGIYIHILYIL